MSRSGTPRQYFLGNSVAATEFPGDRISCDTGSGVTPLILRAPNATTIGLVVGLVVGRPTFCNFTPRVYQKRSQKVKNHKSGGMPPSGVARTQPMPGHSVGTLRLRRTQAPPSFKPLAVRNAEAARGVWGMLPQKILEFLSFIGRF